MRKNCRTEYWKGERVNIERMFFSLRGATLQSVADSYGVTAPRIYQVIQDNDIKTIPKHEALCISIERMLHQHKSKDQIAQSLSISRRRVNNYIIKYKIKNLSVKQKIRYYLKEQADVRLDWLYNNIKRKKRVTDEERFDMLMNMELPKYCPITFLELDYSSDKKMGYRKNKPCIFRFKRKGRNNRNNCAVLSHLGTRIPMIGSLEEMDLFDDWVREERLKRAEERELLRKK